MRIMKGLFPTDFLYCARAVAGTHLCMPMKLFPNPYLLAVMLLSFAICSQVADYTHPSALLLVDNLNSDLSQANNGVWCTMGLGARTALLLKQDGTLAYKQDWFNAGAMTTAVNALIAEKK